MPAGMPMKATMARTIIALADIIHREMTNILGAISAISARARAF